MNERFGIRVGTLWSRSRRPTHCRFSWIRVGEAVWCKNRAEGRSGGSRGLEASSYGGRRGMGKLGYAKGAMYVLAMRHFFYRFRFSRVIDWE